NNAIKTQYKLLLTLYTQQTQDVFHAENSKKKIIKHPESIRIPVGKTLHGFKQQQKDVGQDQTKQNNIKQPAHGCIGLENNDVQPVSPRIMVIGLVLVLNNVYFVWYNSK